MGLKATAKKDLTIHLPQGNEFNIKEGDVFNVLTTYLQGRHLIPSLLIHTKQTAPIGVSAHCFEVLIQ